MLGQAGVRVFIFGTLPNNANYIRGLPCNVKFTLKRPWEDNEGV